MNIPPSARWAFACAALIQTSAFATTATSLASFGGIEEPAVIYYPSTHTFVPDSFKNITDEGGGVIQMMLRYNIPDPGWWDGDRTTSNTDRGRAEIKTLGPHQMIHETYEYATTWRTNPEFRGSGAFCHITQLKSVDGLEGSSGAPMITTSIFSGTNSAAVRYASTSFSPYNVFSPKVVRNITFTPGSWTAQTIRVRATADGENTGLVLVSLNGDAFQGVTGVEVSRPESTEYYPKWGLYRGQSLTSNFSPADYIQHSNVSNNKIATSTADPTFSPAEGTYSPLPAVTLSSTTAGASIRYTLDGSTPTDTVGTLYTGPITLSGTTTVKAVAYSASLPISSVTSATYTLGVLPPSLEAENLTRTSTGATTSVQTDANTSGGKWISLDAKGAGSYVEYTLPNIAAGVYTFQMSYKTNNNRGTLQLALDGVNLSGPLDQYRVLPSIYPTQTFGVVTFATTGDHIVRLTCLGKNAASSGFGLSADKFFLTPVPDTTGPVLTIPSNIVVEATDSDGAEVDFAASATDDRDGPVAVTLSPDSGSVFPLGTTTVNVSAKDKAGNVTNGSFTVTVQDTTAPSISSLTPSLTTLWPANHKMVAVSIAADVIDTADSSPTSKIISVTSNEPVTGTGNGDVGPDWDITGDLTLNLRAERAGAGSGRIYTVTVQSTDASGNATTGTVEVTVPKSAPKS
jgi:hypothetical protein